MTGGEAFVWDPWGRLTAHLNTAMVEAARPEAEQVEELRWLVERHFELTGSPRAKELLDDWDAAVDHMWHIGPLGRVPRIEAGGASRVGASA